MVLMRGDQPLWKAQYESQKKYDSANTVRTNIKLNKNTDADILSALASVKSKQGFIKDAIRFYIAHSEDFK